jgi:hypothetical protein
MRAPADPRQRRLDDLLRALSTTEAGRAFDLGRIATFDDLRASVPIMDATAHREQVETRLGFGAGLEVELSTAAERERGLVQEVWTKLLQPRETTRQVAWIGTSIEDPRVESIRLDDLRAITAEHPTITRLEDPDARVLVERLHELQPEGLVLPSLRTCGWLESVVRRALEREISSLRWLMAEHDLDARTRTRLPVLATSWIHAAGRLGLPSERAPTALVLATDSTLIELLPHGDHVDESRERTPTSTLLPEHAVMGESYELVLSSPLGFLRLRSGEHVHVVGFEGATDPYSGRPRPRVERLPPPPPDVKLEGMTLAGAWLTAALRQAFQPEDPALVAAEIGPDPATRDRSSGQTSRTRVDDFAETELGSGLSRRTGRDPRAILARVEVQGQSAKELGSGLARRLDESLRTRSSAYRWLRDRGELLEPRVVVAPGGTARTARLRRLAALAGPIDVPQIRVQLTW